MEPTIQGRQASMTVLQVLVGDESRRCSSTIRMRTALEVMQTLDSEEGIVN